VRCGKSAAIWVHRKNDLTSHPQAHICALLPIIIPPGPKIAEVRRRRHVDSHSFSDASERWRWHNRYCRIARGQHSAVRQTTKDDGRSARSRPHQGSLRRSSDIRLRRVSVRRAGVSGSISASGLRPPSRARPAIANLIPVVHRRAPPSGWRVSARSGAGDGEVPVDPPGRAPGRPPPSFYQVSAAPPNSLSNCSMRRAMPQ
jgi:hypothetical protein